MREIVLDTETTGLDPFKGDRIVEIGAVELINHLPSGNVYHQYINPERSMPAEAEAIHGLGDAFLADKPTFSSVAEDFLAFVGDDTLVIHNASFDVKFLNAELSQVNLSTISYKRVIDTLDLARRKHPAGPNSLDALCKRYRIDNTKRTLHGALLDSELLAEVYLELIGGRQTSLSLAAVQATKTVQIRAESTQVKPRRTSLPSRLTPAERTAHKKFVDDLGSTPIWQKYPLGNEDPSN